MLATVCCDGQTLNHVLCLLGSEKLYGPTTCNRALLRGDPANSKHLYNICTTSSQRLRRWSNIVQMLYKRFVFTGERWGCKTHVMKRAHFRLLKRPQFYWTSCRWYCRPGIYYNDPLLFTAHPCATFVELQVSVAIAWFLFKYKCVSYQRDECYKNGIYRELYRSFLSF